MARAGRMPFPLLIAAAICLTLALASLATPSGPTYDPYAWLVWGRDLAHLDLMTRGTGTSWKPLPALIDAALTPIGKHADDGWLVVARAGAFYALFMAFRLAWRLAPRSGRVTAGLIAAASLALAQGWLPQTGMGYSEGLTVAFCLLAVDRHLDGHRVQAFLLISTAGLTRVEAWPFAVGYAGWLWASSGRGRDRVAIVLGLLAIPVLWFGGDWLGSGHPFTAAARALGRQIPGSPGASAHPAVAVVSDAFTTLPLPAWIGLAAGLVMAHAWRPVMLALAGSAAAWTAIVAVMAQWGYRACPASCSRRPAWRQSSPESAPAARWWQLRGLSPCPCETAPRRRARAARWPRGLSAPSPGSPSAPPSQSDPSARRERSPSTSRRSMAWPTWTPGSRTQSATRAAPSR